jgi:hypothetical protein
MSLSTRNRWMALAVALAALVAPRTASACYDAPDCALPPSNAWGSGSVSMNGGATYDSRYVGLWAASPSHIETMWSGLEMESCDWDEGWGHESVADLGKPLSRLMNAAYIVRLVEGYASIPGFGLWRGVSGIPEQRFAEGQYWAFSSEWGADEWEPTCEGDDIASHHLDTDEWNTMELLGSYLYEAANRGSTIVHETTHQEVSHIDGAGCNPYSESCDAFYSDFNANTMQVNFLHDGILTYRTTQGSNGPVRRVLRTGDQCSLWPRFSAAERTEMMSRANEVMDRFQGGPPGAWKFQLAGQVANVIAAETFPCASCSEETYTFDAGKCEQTACNEVLNPLNAGANANNRAACQAYQASLASNLTEESVADALDQFADDLTNCGGIQAAEATAYCNAEKSGAAHVLQIDECGWLEGAYGLVTSKLGCVKQFCQAKFQLNPNAGWEDGDDPFGCLDYLCGGEACGDAGARDQCTLAFLMEEGNLSVAQCEWKGCQRDLIACLFPYWQGGQWSVGDPFPLECELVQFNCKVASMLATLVAVNMNPIVDPGPLLDFVDPALQSGNPSASLFDYAKEIRLRAAAGASDAELEALAEDFTSVPETISALYQLMPEQFVWLYGSDGFEGVLPPSVRQVIPKAIEPSMLNARGRAALAAFEKLRSGLPAEGIHGTIGTFKSGP